MKFYCRLYKVPKNERKSRIEKCLGLVNLNEDDKKIVRQFFWRDEKKAIHRYIINS